MRRVTLLLCGVVLVAAPTARATNPNWPNPNATLSDLVLPANWPDDPGYGFMFQSTCPPGTPMAGQTVWRPKDGEWAEWSFFPPDMTDPCGQNESFTLTETLVPSERTSMQGTGMSADVAWTMTTGDPHILIAIHDSGAGWGDSDLVNKWYLNKGELPLPEKAGGAPCADYDCNGDGVFNVLDYTSGSGHAQPAIATVVDPRITGYQCAGNPQCHGDTNGNGLLDPEDLIVIFSDGSDNDGDGFIDDISGWDFFHNTNDPIDDENYGHGNLEANWSSAEGNNGIGGLGVCPDCRVMMVRVGDSFIADSSHFAEGVFFSLSQGANVISEALGTINDSAVAQAAIDAAYNQGSIVIASAADEDSIHHNAPGNDEHTLLVHTVENDNDTQNATSFVRFANCSNGGGHLALSTPGGGCSSEATGRSAGQAGLLYSAMLQYHPGSPQLTPAEIMQLMWTTSEDINVPGSTTNPDLFPSGPGWDLYFGYGRNDAGAAVAAVKAGAIPPEIDITAPRWFETVDPTKTTKLAITGRIAASRATSYDYEVFVAAGTAPGPTDLQPVANVTGSTMLTNGKLGEADITKLISNPSAVSDDPNAFAAVIVVNAVAHYGGTIGDVKGTFRKAFFVHRDPDLFSGFPVYLGASGESSPHLVDLDGSGHDTLVIATSDGYVHAIESNGKERAGWPVAVDPLLDGTAHSHAAAYETGGAGAGARQAIDATVAVGSLLGDKKMQVVASTLDGQLFVWNADGSRVSGFPVSAIPENFKTGAADTTLQDGTRVVHQLGQGFFASPALYDLDGNGTLEIIQPGEDGWLYVWDAHGNPFPGFPVQVYDKNGYRGSTHVIDYARLMATPAIGDINGDGSPEIVLGSNETFGGEVREYAIWHDGNNHHDKDNNPTGAFLPGWPVKITSIDDTALPDVATGQPNPAALADVNGDGILDVGVGPLSSAPFFYDGSGTLLGTADPGPGNAATVTDPVNLVAVNSGAFGDIDGDGKLEFVDGTLGSSFAIGGLSGAERIKPSHAVNAWSVQQSFEYQGVGFTATPLPAFPASVPDYQFFMNYGIADIGGKGKTAILSGSGVYLVTALQADGSEPSGWPKNTGGWVISTPAIGDLDGDGYLDVASLTREGWLFAWHTKGLATQKIEWEGYHHDARNTGNYETPLPARAGPKKAGCHCGESGPETLVELLVLLPLMRLRLRSLRRMTHRAA